MSCTSVTHPNAAELTEHYASSAERRADKLVHLIGIAVSAAIGTSLFARALYHCDPSIAGGIALYSLCTLVMLACSALYNLAQPSGARRLLRRLDETAIFAMIAGTCTPYLLKLPSHQWEAQGLEWAMAAACAVGKMLAPRLRNHVSTVLYVTFGGVSLLLMGPTGASLPFASLACLAAVVATYCVGLWVFLNDSLPYRRAMWHALIVIAAAVDFGALATGLVYA
jgi:hemolysin III